MAQAGVADDEKLAVLGGEYALSYLAWDENNPTAVKISSQDYAKVEKLFDKVLEV